MRLDVLAVLLVIACFTVCVSSDESSTRQCDMDGFQKGYCILIEKETECKGQAISYSSCASTHKCCTPGPLSALRNRNKGRGARAGRGGRGARAGAGKRLTARGRGKNAGKGKGKGKNARRQPGTTGMLCAPNDPIQFGSGRCVPQSVRCRDGNFEAPTTKCQPGFKCCAPRKTSTHNVENTAARPHNPRARANLAPGKDISVSKNHCVPVSRDFMPGNCVASQLEGQCRNTPGTALVPSKPCSKKNPHCCPSGQQCCAPRKNPKAQSVDPAEKTKSCRPTDPNLPVGRCMVNLKNCKGGGRIVPHRDGCTGRAKCCVDMAAAPKRTSGTQSCTPTKSHYFIGLGQCVQGGAKARQECSRADRAITPATGCQAGFECCARRRPASGQCTTPVGATNGTCMSPRDAQSRCRASHKTVVRGAEGCAQGEVCCADRIDEKCNEAGQSVVNGLHHTYDWRVPSPFVDWRRTEPYEHQGTTLGVRLFFQVRATINIKADISCVMCGKTSRYPGINLKITKTLLVPFKVTGSNFARSPRGTVIPGLNVAILANEVAQLHETARDVKESVELLISKIRTSSDMFKCTPRGIDRAHAISRIPSLVGTKGTKRTIEVASAEEIVAAVNNLEHDEDTIAFELPEEVVEETYGEIDMDAALSDN